MRFLTLEQCRELAAETGHRLGSAHEPVRPTEEQHHVRRRIPTEHARLLWFSTHLVQSLGPHEGCLLWFTEWGVWPSAENWHLFNRLRQSYGEQRPLHEAPGQLFLRTEAPDLVTFIEVAVLSGWGGHLLPVAGQARAFVSHDEFVEFAASDLSLVAGFAQPLTPFGSAPAA